MKGVSTLLSVRVKLGAPMLPTWWVKISIYLHLELFLLIIFMLLIVNRIYYYYYAINPMLKLWSVLLLYSYHYQFNWIITIIIISCFTVKCFLFIISFPYHLCLFICLFVFLQVCAPAIYPWLYVVCPLCSYVYLYCAVSVIGLVAINSAHK
jgi:hypothetical protein